MIGEGGNAEFIGNGFGPLELNVANRGEFSARNCSAGQTAHVSRSNSPTADKRKSDMRNHAFQHYRELPYHVVRASVCRGSMTHRSQSGLTLLEENKQQAALSAGEYPSAKRVHCAPVRATLNFAFHELCAPHLRTPHL